MLEKILDYIKELNDISIIVVTSILIFLDNLFPPFPSDAVLMVSSGLLKNSSSSTIILFLSCSLLSTLGFLSVYFIGRFFGKQYVENKRFKFISPNSLDRAHRWFEKIGFHLILLNRFFPGIRSVISLFSGINHLKFHRVFLLSLISSMVWNGLLIYIGHTISMNWQKLRYYLSNYSVIISSIVLVFIIFWFWKRLKKGTNEN